MSETILKITLADLETARLTCLACKVTIELAAKDLDNMHVKLVCPGCGKPYRTNADDAIARLGKALAEVRQAAQEFSLEFVGKVRASP